MVNYDWMYLITDINETVVWAPRQDAPIEVNPKKQVILFLAPRTMLVIMEPARIPYPTVCCAVPKSNSFLITWFIFNFEYINEKHMREETVAMITMQSMILSETVGIVESTSIVSL